MFFSEKKKVEYVVVCTACVENTSLIPDIIFSNCIKYLWNYNDKGPWVGDG